MFIKRLFLLLTVAYNFHKTTAVHYHGEIEIECENDTCTKCYKTLATELLKNADNYIALQSTFFPPDDSGPDFVIVTYVFDDQHSSVNETTESDEIGSASQNLELIGDIWFDEQYNIDVNKVSQNLSNHIWFWSSSAYFFYHPLRVIQFTSLGFSDPYLRQRNVSLRLPASCYYSEGTGDRGPFNMKLLTQRLQLFAMHQKITGQIDSTYTAQSHSLETLRDWHVQNPHVSRLVLSSQCIFPAFASIFLVLYFVYLIESEPVNFGKKLNSQAADESPDEIKHAALSKVWIIVTISILFTAGVIAADIGALVEYTQLPEEIKSYFNDHSDSASIYLYVVPITMLFFDFLSLLFIFGPCIVTVVACCKCCQCIQEHCSKNDNSTADEETGARKEQKYIQKCCKYSCCWCECEFKVSNSLYTLLSPLSCIATHSYHIIFAFINNPYHATSVLLFYIMTLFVVVVIFQKTYYFVLNCFERKQKAKTLRAVAVQTSVEPVAVETSVEVTEQGSRPTTKPCVQCGKGCGKRCALVSFFIVVSVALATCIGLTVAVLIALPINNAIDLASTEIYAIYQASVTVFAALVTFQVVFRPTNSIFAVFLKAADKRVKDKKQGNWKKWEKMSEKEKEIHLGDALLSHIDFEPLAPSIRTLSIQTEQPRTPDGEVQAFHVPTPAAQSDQPDTPEPPQPLNEVPQTHETQSAESSTKNESPQGQAMSASLSIGTTSSPTAPLSSPRASTTSSPKLSQVISKDTNLSPNRENHQQPKLDDLDSTDQHSNVHIENEMDDMHSCQVYRRRDRDKVESRINAREARAKFYGPHPLSGDYVLPHPLNIEIYGLIFDNILSLCLCHTSICAIELDSGTMVQNQVNRDTTGT